MSPIDVLAGVAMFSGALVLLAGVRQLRRTPLAERLAPYAPPTTSGPRRTTGPGAVSEMLSPLADSFGRRLGRASGIRTDLDTRLVRAGRTVPASDFRMAQFTRVLAAFASVAVLLVLARPGVGVTLLALVGIPLLVALAQEQLLDNEARRRTATIELQLPVVAEQLGILLGAGLSLSSAMDRVARRSNGVVAEDLAAVVRKTRQGRSEIDALREWSDTTEAEGLARLVGVLALHREAADLGSLISVEARGIRAATHRQLLETIERRAQLVWVPVTVATLVPGLLLIGVPFVSAMSQVTG